MIKTWGFLFTLNNHHKRSNLKNLKQHGKSFYPKLMLIAFLKSNYTSLNSSLSGTLLLKAFFAQLKSS